jgi:hypothetical protein
MSFKALAVAAVAAISIFSAGSAGATVYNWSFNAPSDDNGSGQFTTDASNHVVSGGGTFYLPHLNSGSFAANLAPNPTPGSTSTSPDGSFYFDNQFGVDNAGLLFVDGANDYINIYAPVGQTLGVGTWDAYLGASAPGSWWVVGGQGGEAGILTISTAAVPEPASWALMMIGVGGVGAMLRSRRSKQLSVA